MKKVRIIIEVLMLLIGIIVLLPQVHFIITLFKSLAVQIGIGLILLSVIYLLFKQKRTSAIALICGLCFLFQTDFWKWEKSIKTSVIVPDMTVAHINVLKFNHAHKELIESLKQELGASDIISFQEVDFTWNKDLIKAFETEYPHIVSHPRNDCYGLLVMSKFPIKDFEVDHIYNLPFIEAEILVKSKSTGRKIPCQLVFMHASTPMNPQRHEKRNAQINGISMLADHPNFIIGDFNSVPWDEHLQDMKQRLSVTDSRKNYQATYPSHLPFKLPIDYIFHDGNWRCNSFDVMHKTTSDHLGIIGSYSYKTKEVLTKN